MPGKIAKRYFRRVLFGRSYNCAQAVLKAFEDRFDFINDKLVKEFKAFGVGKAPDSICGTLFAALHILKELKMFDTVSDFEQEFYRLAGSLYCSNIRTKGFAFCSYCLEEAVFCLDSHIKEPALK